MVSCVLVALLGLTIFIVNCQAAGPLDLPLIHNLKKPEFDKCLDESGLTKDDLKYIYNYPPKDATTKELCLGKCLAKSAGLLKDDGTLNSELIKKSVPPSEDTATVRTVIKCMEDAGPVTTCDDMAKIENCVPVYSSTHTA